MLNALDVALLPSAPRNNTAGERCSARRCMPYTGREDGPPHYAVHAEIVMSPTSTPLEGTVAIVTGGSRGIGLASARLLLERGAQVVISSRREDGLRAAHDELEAFAPGRSSWYVCHMGEPESVAGLFDAATARHGKPNVLVNNAGTNPSFGPALHVQWGAWDKTFDVNLKGPFEASRQLAERLLADGRPGSIINVSSIFGLRGAPMQLVYAMTKAALISMTQTLAQE
jgi:NAD(P)-dependent dehydrogenase (short-subunit alcohol dehydrogenase family)